MDPGSLLILLALTTLYPLSRAWAANTRTSLAFVAAWLFVGWAAWLLALPHEVVPAAWTQTLRFIALCVTGACAIGVLGARRPYAAAWNFVLLGLLSVMLLPLAESLVTGVKPLDTLRLVFMAATVAVGVVNYLPTRLGPVAAWFGAAMAAQIYFLDEPPSETMAMLGHAAVFATPWLGLAAWNWGRQGQHELDRRWLDFRDRYGLMWAQRAREQFGQAAENAGWPIVLTWSGFKRTADALPPELQQELLDTLAAVLKRFVAEQKRD